MGLEKPANEQRSQKRACERKMIEPRDTGHLLEALIQDRTYQFRVLNVCLGGVGMLVKASNNGVLKFLKPGSTMEMNYINPKGVLEIKVEIRHVTQLCSGPYRGDYCVGFSMSI